MDPVQLYRANSDHQRFEEKIARISSPVLIVQGDGPSELNRFNAEVLIPELRAAGTSLEVRTYPGEPHCFAFANYSRSGKAFQDIDGFIRRYVETQPDEHVPVELVPFSSERVAITVSSEILADYVGTYELAPGLDLVVTLEDNQLMAQAPGQDKAQLFAMTETEFFAEASNVQFEFVRGDDGNVTDVIAHMGPNDITAPRK